MAAIVSLHVEAKRYLVATEGAYGRVLTTDSVVSLGRQGGALAEEEAASFRARPWAADALLLRRADDSGKVEGLEVAGLGRVGTAPAPALRGRRALAARLTGAGCPTGCRS